MIKSIEENVEGKEPLVMRFTNNAYHDIVNTIGRVKSESGGLLFGYTDDYVVREFVFDEFAETTSCSYTFNVSFLNTKIKELWEDRGLACIGFIHSHPFNSKYPSWPDMKYFKYMFKHMYREMYLVPIVSSIPDGGFNLNPCILFNGDKEVTVADTIELVIEKHVSKYEDLIKPPKKHIPTLVEIKEDEPTFDDLFPPKVKENSVFNFVKDLTGTILNGLFENRRGSGY